MTNTAEFEAKLLLEKVNVIKKLQDINNTILNDITYIDKKICIDYYGRIDLIIASIGFEYDSIRERGKGTPHGHQMDTLK